MSFKKIEENGTVILSRFDGNFTVPSYVTAEWKKINGESLKTAVAIDLETTGLDCAKDKIIEIGLRSFTFDRRNGDIVEVGESYDELEDPKTPLSKAVAELTGLSDHDLKDRSINWTRVSEIFDKADVVIAHKADFERSFIDSRLPSSNSKIWACSLSQVDWNLKGFKCHKLEVLSYYHGFFLEFHRAMQDVDALIHLLSFVDQSSGKPYLIELLDAAKLPRIKILATGSPFETKDLLKGNGYRWNSQNRVWWKSSLANCSQSEIEWLEEHVYFGPFRGSVQTLRLSDHFKSDLL